MLHVLTFLSLQIPRDPERRSIVLVVYLDDVHGPAVGRCWRHVDAEVELGVGIDGGHQPLGRRCDKHHIDIRLRAKLMAIKLPYFTLLVFIAIHRHDMNILQITQNIYAAMYNVFTNKKLLPWESGPMLLNWKHHRLRLALSEI